jgi:hypothetical protein
VLHGPQRDALAPARDEKRPAGAPQPGTLGEPRLQRFPGLGASERDSPVPVRVPAVPYTHGLRGNVVDVQGDDFSGPQARLVSERGKSAVPGAARGRCPLHQCKLLP